MKIKALTILVSVLFPVKSDADDLAKKVQELDLHASGSSGASAEGASGSESSSGASGSESGSGSSGSSGPAEAMKFRATAYGLTPVAKPHVTNWFVDDE